MSTLVCIDAPHFCSGIIVRDGTITEAAPILKWAIGKKYDWFRVYCERKRWKVTLERVEAESS